VSEPPRYAALVPGEPTGAAAVLDAIVADPAPAVPGRPRTIGVMVASIDGHATVAGRSGALGGPEDRAIFRGVRERADALLVGTGTLNRERYATVLDDDQRERRRAAGRTPEPLLATVTRSGSLDADVPVLHEVEARVLVVTEQADAALEQARAVELVQVVDASPATVLGELHRREIGLVACEGGPTLLAALVRDGLLDELLLTVSPLLVGTATTGAPTILDGAIGVDPLTLRPRGVWRSGDVLFHHLHLSDGSPA
jgi:riboflavin biosynthesis pyrimidine reductase